VAHREAVATVGNDIVAYVKPDDVPILVAQIELLNDRLVDKEASLKLLKTAEKPDGLALAKLAKDLSPSHEEAELLAAVAKAYNEKHNYRYQTLAKGGKGGTGRGRIDLDRVGKRLGSVADSYGDGEGGRRQAGADPPAGPGGGDRQERKVLPGLVSGTEANGRSDSPAAPATRCVKGEGTASADKKRREADRPPTTATPPVAAATGMIPTTDRMSSTSGRTRPGEPRLKDDGDVGIKDVTGSTTRPADPADSISQTQDAALTAHWKSKAHSRPVFPVPFRPAAPAETRHNLERLTKELEKAAAAVEIAMQPFLDELPSFENPPSPATRPSATRSPTTRDATRLAGQTAGDPVTTRPAAQTGFGLNELDSPEGDHKQRELDELPPPPGELARLVIRVRLRQSTDAIDPRANAGESKAKATDTRDAAKKP